MVAEMDQNMIYTVCNRKIGSFGEKSVNDTFTHPIGKFE